MSETIRFMTVLLASAALCLMSGCVGERMESDAATEEGRAEESAMRRAAADTVAPVEYQVFDSVVHDQDARKVEFRLLALRNAERPALVKTLRLALDSIGRADSTLVAARGVLYLYDARSPRQGKLVPGLWGEWVPKVGWDSATAGSRRQPHVVFTYDVPLPAASSRAGEPGS